MLDTILVFLLIAAAAAYVIYRLIVRQDCGCGPEGDGHGCSCCETPPKPKGERFPPCLGDKATAGNACPGCSAARVPLTPERVDGL